MNIAIEISAQKSEKLQYSNERAAELGWWKKNENEKQMKGRSECENVGGNQI